jgi:hypothetical protein
MREDRIAVRERAEREHIWGVTDTNADHGWHREGSAIAYYEDTAPGYRPDGTTALTALDTGRLWIDSNASAGEYHLYHYSGSAWVGTKALVAPGDARQILQTNAGGNASEWTDNIDVVGTLGVNGAATLDSTLAVTGVVTLSDNLFGDYIRGATLDVTGRVGIGTLSPVGSLQIGDYFDATESITLATTTAGFGKLNFFHNDLSGGAIIKGSASGDSVDSSLVTQGGAITFANMWNTENNQIVFDLGVALGPRVGIGVTSSIAGTLHVRQGSDVGSTPPLTLDQKDVDYPMINFYGTNAGDSSRTLSSSGAENSDKKGAILVNVNGSGAWIRTYDSAV